MLMFLVRHAESTWNRMKKIQGQRDPQLSAYGKKEAKLLAWNKAQEFSAKHKGWKYEIAEWKAKDLTAELTELIEDEKKTEDVQGPQEPNSVIENQPVEPNSV